MSQEALIERLKRATDRTAGVGRGVHDMRESSRTMPVTVRELKYVEQMVEEAVTTIEAQARRIADMCSALEAIAQSRYGLQGIQEDHGDDTNAYNYHAMKYFHGVTISMQAMARSAIARNTASPPLPDTGLQA